ncbi:hypothetical protein HYH02_008288 [Chlamydomonas schloesseri]|uniref:phytol kinase n=1 Tax=Chlamydomonas schloesseri TaxID=2026947 RepID=A0A835WG09_9CHLO|nr:hypothetical protein HYH02_008288 [Chlamydomonas schloesseri]|eukprot:KAG2446726.1 hypothetical protein HYH02_008288 [Chlamydomonas schloesseri]
MADQGKLSRPAALLFEHTGWKLASAPTSAWSRLEGVPRALLRADLLSTYSRYLSSVGKLARSADVEGSGGETDATGGGSGGAGASGSASRISSGGSAARLSVAALLCHVETMLTIKSLLVFINNFAWEEEAATLRTAAAAAAQRKAPSKSGRGKPGGPPSARPAPPPSLEAELLTALARSHLLEHMAAAILRLAAACQPAHTAAVVVPETQLAAAAEAAPATAAVAAAAATSHGASEATALAPGTGKAGAAAERWVPVTQAVAALCELAGQIAVTAKKRLTADKRPPEGGSSSTAAIQHESVDWCRVIVGPCVQYLLAWALGCARLTVEQEAAAAAAAGGAPGGACPHSEPVVIPVGAAASEKPVALQIAAAAEPTEVGTPPMLLMQPLCSQCGSSAANVTVAAAVLRDLSFALQVSLRAQAHDGWRSQQQASGEQQDGLQPFPPARVYDLLSAALPSFGVKGIKHSEQLAVAYADALNDLVTMLQQGLSARQVARRLPGLWRLLVQQLTGMLSSFQAVVDALQLDSRPRVAAAAAADAQAASPSGPSYSLRCALNAGLLPALERALRVPEASASAPGKEEYDSGSDSGSDIDSDSDSDNGSDVLGGASVLAHVNVALASNGVWPAVLAHSSLQEATSLLATLAAVGWHVADGQHDKVLKARYVMLVGLVTLMEQACGALESADQGEAGAGGGGASDGRTGGRSGGHSGRQGDCGAAGSNGTASESVWCATLRFTHECKYLTLADLMAQGGVPPAGSAAAAQQSVLGSFALQQWLPPLVRMASSLSNVLCRDPSDAAQSDGTGIVKLVTVVLQLFTRGAMQAAAIKEAAGASASAATAGAGRTATGGPSPSSGTAPAATVAADAEQQLKSWVEGVLTPSLMAMHGVLANVLLPGNLNNVPGGLALEGALLDALQASVAVDIRSSVGMLSLYYTCTRLPPGSGGGHCKASTQPEAGLLSVLLLAVARRRGRRAFVTFLESAIRALGDLPLILLQHLTNKGDEVVPPAVMQRHDLAVAEVAAAAKRLQAALLQDPEWRLRCARAQWLLSPAAVARRLRELGIEARDSASSSSAGDAASSNGSGASGGVAPAATCTAVLCGNPACCNLAGPNAFIQPGSGISCTHCRRIRYCGVVCQEAHWSMGGHEAECVGMEAPEARTGIGRDD